MPLVIGPKKPTAGVMLFASWNLIKDARVKAPNLFVSNPGEPAPESVTGKPCVFKYFWSCSTSG